jgi:hypothetical protein
VYRTTWTPIIFRFLSGCYKPRSRRRARPQMWCWAVRRAACFRPSSMGTRVVGLTPPKGANSHRGGLQRPTGEQSVGTMSERGPLHSFTKHGRAFNGVDIPRPIRSILTTSFKASPAFHSNRGRLRKFQKIQCNVRMVCQRAEKIASHHQ